MSTQTTEAVPAQEAVISVPIEQRSEQPQQSPESRAFSKEDIEKARQQEKDKLYGKLSDLESKFAEAQKLLQEQAKAREAETAEQQKAREAAEEAARKKAEDEMSAKELLAKKEAEWQQRFSQYEQEREQERVLFAKEQEFNNLRSYAQTLVQTALANNEIAPELADFVGGNTKEEIDASLDIVKAKSDAIVQNIAQAQVQARAAMKGVSATGYSTTGPMDTNQTHQQYSVEDLKNMPMSEWAKIRGNLIPASSQGQNRGLYG